MLRQYWFLTLLMLFPTTALAQTTEQVSSAREHFSRGEMAFRETRWTDCAVHFEASFQEIFAPELLYNIGLCYEHAAVASATATYADRALAAYSRYLRELPAAADVAEVRLRISNLQQFLERVRPAAEVAPVEIQLPALDPLPPEEYAVGDVVVVGNREPERGFGFGWTLTAGALTLASFVAAIGLSAAAQEQFDELASTCGLEVLGCSREDVDGLSALVNGANIMYAVSGVFLAATGVALGVEFYLWVTPEETHASLSYALRF